MVQIQPSFCFSLPEISGIPVTCAWQCPSNLYYILFFLSALFVSQFDTLEIQLNGKLGSNTDGDSEGIAYAHLLWSIPGGSSSSCFCCDFLLDQRPLADSARALSKFVQCLFLLSLSFSFFPIPSFSLAPPSYPSPHPQLHFIWPPSWRARCAYCC